MKAAEARLGEPERVLEKVNHEEFPVPARCITLLLETLRAH